MTLLERAITYHTALPDRIRQYLNTRGIPDSLIDLHLLGWNGRRITIPILNAQGEIAFFKLAKDPDDHGSGPKMLATRSSHVELYGWEEIKRTPKYVIVCEGEFDRLVLEARGFIAVTSTGGAGSFREEWATAFAAVPSLYICYDRDAAGRKGATTVARLLPQTKIIILPPEVGEGGDVTDFFVRLGRTRADFLLLMKAAELLPPPSLPVLPEGTPFLKAETLPSRERIERVKQQHLIAEVIGRSVKLSVSGNILRGLCPFHKDSNPSLVVYPHTQSFHCFGCRKTGDVITFIREREGLTFSQALDVLERSPTSHDGEQQAA